MGQSVEVDIEKLLRTVLESALATQQPFFTSMLNQIARLESGDGKHEESIMILRDAINKMVNQEYHERIKTLELRVKQLEDAQVARTTLVKATEWFPRMFGYFMAAVIAIVAYVEHKK